jgi:hypothetical protein
MSTTPLPDPSYDQISSTTTADIAKRGRKSSLRGKLVNSGKAFIKRLAKRSTKRSAKR